MSFSVANEMLPTTAPGPYTLNLYTDNPVIKLQAVQSGVMSSFFYNWLTACNGTTPPANTPPVANPNANQTATVGVPFSYTVNAFTDAETPTMLTYSASIVPMNGFSFNPATRVISGTPSMSGVSSVTVVATDPGSLSASTSFTITVSPAGTPPPSGPFAITGVTTVSCATVSAGLRTVSFTPLYSGLNGSPVSFSVVNEMLPTTAPGPYSLNLYTDNPVITLKAVQSGSESSFVYNWLTACNGGSAGSARLGAGREVSLKATLLPNPVGEEFRVRIEGAQGQSVRLELSDVNGHSVLSRVVDVVGVEHQESIRFRESGHGLYLLRVSTGQQALTLKVIRE